MQMFSEVRSILLLGIFVLLSSFSYSQETSLPAVAKKGGISMMETLWKRKSERTFSNKLLSDNDLSNLLWAACGINRAENGKRTNPTALNKQEVSVYVFLADRVALYDYKGHTLKTVAKGDHRKLLAQGQDFVLEAPVTLVLVGDLSVFGARNERSLTMVAADAGIVSQNINLFCAAYGLATVTRATMDQEGIARLLGLSDTQLPILNNPVGYGK